MCGSYCMDIDPDTRTDWRCNVLVANILARLDRKREELEIQEKDLKTVDNLISSLQKQRAIIIKEINDLEYEITELEEEME